MDALCVSGGFDESFGTLGAAFQKTQQLLRALGVSHEAIDVFVDRAFESFGAAGKLTGAGKGGCLIILVDKHDLGYTFVSAVA